MGFDYETRISFYDKHTEILEVLEFGLDVIHKAHVNASQCRRVETRRRTQRYSYISSRTHGQRRLALFSFLEFRRDTTAEQRPLYHSNRKRFQEKRKERDFGKSVRLGDGLVVWDGEQSERIDSGRRVFFLSGRR